MTPVKYVMPCSWMDVQQIHPKIRLNHSLRRKLLINHVPRSTYRRLALRVNSFHISKSLGVQSNGSKYLAHSHISRSQHCTETSYIMIWYPWVRVEPNMLTITGKCGQELSDMCEQVFECGYPGMHWCCGETGLGPLWRHKDRVTHIWRDPKIIHMCASTMAHLLWCHKFVITSRTKHDLGPTTPTRARSPTRAMSCTSYAHRDQLSCLRHNMNQPLPVIKPEVCAKCW